MILVSFIRDGSELKYRIDSRVVLVAASNHFPQEKDDIWVDLQMRHSNNQSAVWNISCGILDNLGSWDLNACTATPFPLERTVQCICPSTGTFAAFLTTRAVKVINSLITKMLIKIL